MCDVTPLVGGELHSRKYTMIPISAYFSRRGPKREIQSNQASCTHTPSTTDSYSCYVSAELSFIQLDLCEKIPICQFMYLYFQYEIIL